MAGAFIYIVLVSIALTAVREAAAGWDLAEAPAGGG